ncbi:MAG: hypothetical protein CVV64_06245 [Candidatus Wallbacteria bacterium HGW-Wallbacteria-1]|jgi:hypothetical protein|uniref:SbsA Ig-like domain-containing protein n=1 Tax=Candidatus Wallbacteria bacterium HGW-Wallbacteria-1 TaxID=2013854 RepID=A0A2N1PSP7_9BACT|nr:MAG: hypothetical protein CVV64_06245 [Candidatus Wallbacteria bacterium HGW-Wallbacteria-1]
MARFDKVRTSTGIIITLLTILWLGVHLNPGFALGPRASIISPSDQGIYISNPQLRVEIYHPDGVRKDSIRASIDGISIAVSDWGTITPSGTTAEVFELVADLSTLVTETQGRHIFEILEAFSASTPSLGIIESPVRVSFTVDSVAPQVLGVNPGELAKIGDATPLVEIRFSEPMDPSSLSGSAGPIAAVMMSSGGLAISGKSEWAQGYTVLYFQPEQPVSLDSGGNADVTFRVGDLKDAAGNIMAAEYIRNFRVSVPEMMAPYISATWPENGQTGVGIDSVVTVNFNKAIDKDTLLNRVSLLAGSRILSYPGQLDSTNAPDPKIFSIRLGVASAPMQTETLHTIVISTGVTATDGTVMDRDYSFSFETGKPVTPPATNLSLLFYRPLGGEEVHTLRPSLSFRFSRVLDPSSIPTGFSITDGIDRTGDFVISDDGKGFTFVPAVDLVPGRTYRWTVGAYPSGILDNNGLGLGSLVTDTFVVGATPLVLSTTPVDGAVETDLLNNISVMFNVTLDTSTVTTASVRVMESGTAIAIKDLTIIGNIVNFKIQDAGAARLMGKTFTVILSSDIRDVYGMKIGRDISFSFTSSGDAISPVVVTTFPGNGDSGISRTPQMVVEFSEQMNTATVDSAFSLVTVSRTGTTTLSSIDGTLSWHSGDSILKFLPNNSLPAGAMVKVTILSTARDKAGNTLDDSGDNNLDGENYQFVFNVIDDNPVTVISTLPAPGATEIPSNFSVSLNFSRVLDQSSVNSAIVVTDSAGQAVAGTITPSGDRRGFTFAADDPFISGPVTVRLISGSGGLMAEIDAANPDAVSPGLDGNGDGVANGSPADDYVFSFSVRNPLRVLATTPANGDSQIRRDIKIPVSLNFSHKLDLGTATPATIKAFAGDEELLVDNIIHGTGLNEVYMEIYLGSRGNFDERLIRVEIAAGLADIRGETLGQSFHFSFTVNNPERPLVLEAGLSPLAGTLNVPVLPTIVIPFSEAMDRVSSQQAFSLTALNGAQNVGRSGVFSWSEDGTVMSFVPNQPLLEATTYEVTIADTAIDLSGAPLQQMVKFGFTTLNTVLPSLVTVIPTNGATDVAIDSRIVFIFSKPMDLSSLYNIVISADRQVTIDRIERDPASTTRYILVPESLMATREYTITIPKTIQDDRGNQLDDKYVSKFTTKGIGDLLEVGAFVMPGDPTRALVLVQTNESVTDSLVVKILQRGSASAVAVTMIKVQPPSSGKHLYKGIYTVNRDPEYIGTAQVLVSARIGGILNGKTEEFVVKE